MNMSPLPTELLAQTKGLIEKLWDHERCGRFESGLLSISEGWAEPCFEPDTKGVPEALALELRLRFASLIGYQGHLKKTKDSQLRARDLLTSLLGRFSELEDHDRSAECENHIALTYWRKGEFAEARTWLDAAMQRPLVYDKLSRLASVMYVMLVNVSEQRYPENVELFERHEESFRKWGDDWITASFYVNAGIGFLEMQNIAEAQRCFELAHYRAERSSIDIYLGSIENELAHVYKQTGSYAKAHLAVDRGIMVFQRLGDLSREGALLDTKAAIYLEEQDLDNALIAAEQAINTLKDGENMGYLADAFLTESRILLWMDNFAGAISALLESVQIARTQAGHEFSKKLIKHFEDELKRKIAGPVPGKRGNDLETGELSLVLPSSIGELSGYKGIWINNSHLECVGVGKGSLVIAADDRIRRGDLVAVSEIETGEISCGFYDADFGVICLEGCNSEPQLFDESAVRIIGKIVGVAGGKKDREGKLIVTAIASRPSLTEI